MSSSPETGDRLTATDQIDAGSVPPEDQPGEARPQKRSRLISRVLSPALRLWLRSQADQMGTLEFQIEGGDRQILSGHIPKVLISATEVVYQGLHLTSMEIVGRDIRVNLGQVLRGKPLQLLEVIPIDLDVVIGEADFNASLQAPLLATAVADFLQSLPTAALFPDGGGAAALEMDQAQVDMQPDQLLFQAQLQPQGSPSEAQPVTFVMRTGIGLASNSEGRQDLILRNPQRPSVNPDSDSQAKPDNWTTIPELDNFKIDLGPDVNLTALAIEAEQLVCQGQILVVPEQQRETTP